MHLLFSLRNGSSFSIVRDSIIWLVTPSYRLAFDVDTHSRTKRISFKGEDLSYYTFQDINKQSVFSQVTLATDNILVIQLTGRIQGGGESRSERWKTQKDKVKRNLLNIPLVPEPEVWSIFVNISSVYTDVCQVQFQFDWYYYFLPVSILN